MSSEEWKKYKLIDFAKLVKKQYQPNPNEDLIYIGLEHIEQQSLSINGTGNSKNVISQKFKFSSGDILFGKLRPYFRKVFRPKFDGVCSTDIWVINAKKDFDQGFLFYFLANQSFIDACNSGSSGTRMPRADWDHLSETEWELPPLSKQRRIAEILSALDDKIELNRQTNATLEAIAKAIFKEWFIDFNYPGATGEMVESELGPIPKGWSVTRLGDEGEFKNGVNYSRDESGDHTYSIVNVRNIVGNRYVLKADLDKIAFDAKKAASYKLSTQDIIIARSASPGEAAILFEPSDDTIFSGFTIRYRVNINEHLLFLFLLIQSIKEKLTDLANGTTLKSINQASLKNVQMVLPDEKTLGDFSTIVSPIFENIFRNQLESRLLCTTRDLLLPHLMNNSLDLG